MPASPFDLTGKVAIVTGSSRGIGRASAELMAQMGAKVVISSRKAEACAEVADGIRKAGGDAHVIPCNISRRAEVEALVAGTLKHYGRLDALVCNAAVNPYYGPLLDISDEAFDKIMGSNVKSNIWLCSLAIPQMAAQGGGSVIIISSIGGLRGSTVMAPTASPRRRTSRWRAASPASGGRRTCASTASRPGSSRPTSPGRCGRTRIC